MSRTKPEATPVDPASEIDRLEEGLSIFQFTAVNVLLRGSNSGNGKGNKKGGKDELHGELKKKEKKCNSLLTDK